MLNSLDSIKKELRHQFKQLTSQEMAVFSCIYDLESQGFIVDYSLISQKMSLSESSIRDYIQKIIKKGIPIVKTKENNKKILLKIDENLKKIASLQTLLTLREI
jgi:Mn-dependent DtxR family transcriptional regulator